MAFFNQLSQKLSQTSQKTKDMAETVRLNSAISEENKKIEAGYREIGRLYCERCADQEDPVLQSAVAQVRQSEAAVREMKDTICRLKGVQSCANCGAELTAGAPFCPACGARQPKPPAEPAPAKGPVCISCGAALSEDAVFCPVCGVRQSEPPAPPAEPAPAEGLVCPSCGAELPEGVAFCPSCGAKQPAPDGEQPEA